MINLLRSYYRINQVAGISVHLHSDGSTEFNCCTVEANRSLLNINKKLTTARSVNDLSKHVPAKTIVALNLSGKGILHKQVPKIMEISQANFGQVLPNGNITDFYVQHFDSGEHSFVSLIRRAEADKWISQLTEKGYPIFSLSLGPFTVEQVASQLNVYEGELIFDGNVIQRNDRGEWIGWRYNATAVTPFVLKIESEKIDEKLLIPYAAAFQLIIGISVNAEVPPISKKLSIHLENLKLKVNGALFLAVLFVLLLINFLFVSWFNADNIRLSAQVSRFARTNSTVHDLGEEIKRKESLLQELGWDSGINKSGLVDEIASLMPAEITLKEIAINPVDLNSSRIQKRLSFSSNRISITGISEKIIPVNEWMARLRTRKWVHHIRLESYTYNSELNTGQFTLSLNY